MPQLLTHLRIDEVSAVIKGANKHARVMVRKMDPDFRDDDDNPHLFNNIMLRKQDEDVTGDHAGDDDKKLSGKLKEIVAAMIVAAPSLHPQHAARWLLHTPQGQNLLAQHTTKKEEQMPRVDILKLIGVVEDGLMAQVTKRDGESYAKSFSRKYENDIVFRKQWAALTEAKHLQAYLKSLATLTPTSTEVGSSQVSNDSAEAVRLLQEMADKQHRTFEQVFTDPANKALAGRTYTAAHRPTASSTSGSELQRR
jgi:hypothetical protein